MENWFGRFGNARRYLPVVLAFVFATLSSVSVYQYLNGRERVSVAKVDPTIPVVVAKRDMTPGVRLTAEDLSVQNWPKEIMSERYFRSPKELVGRTLRTSVISEEPLTASKLMQEGENFASLIPPDMRGVTITVRRSEALTKLLERGSVVDVIALFDDGKNTPAPKVIAQAVRVLAIHDHADLLSTERGPRQMEVTLMVSPRDAEWIVMAMNKGVVELVLRNERNPNTSGEEPPL